MLMLSGGTVCRDDGAYISFERDEHGAYFVRDTNVGINLPSPFEDLAVMERFIAWFRRVKMTAPWW